MKAALVKFVDCTKEIKVGDEIIITNGQSGGHYSSRVAPITKIGRKYFYADRSTFTFKGKYQSDYGFGVCIYSSKESYEEYIEKSRKVTHAVRQLRDISHNITLEEVVEKLKKILGEIQD